MSLVFRFLLLCVLIQLAAAFGSVLLILGVFLGFLGLSQLKYRYLRSIAIGAICFVSILWAMSLYTMG